MKNRFFFIIFLLSINFSLSAQLEVKPNMSIGTSHSGYTTGIHAEASIGVDIEKFRFDARFAHNFSESSQFSADILYSVFSIKRFQFSTGLEYAYSGYYKTAYDGHVVSDPNALRFFSYSEGYCGNSVITYEREYGDYGTIAIPFYMDIILSKKFSMYSNVSFYPKQNETNKCRIGIRYSFDRSYNLF